MFQDNSTPHKLTEWMVEVCRFYLCGVLFMFGVDWKIEVFWAGVDVRCYIITIIILYLIISYTILFFPSDLFSSLPLLILSLLSSPLHLLPSFLLPLLSLPLLLFYLLLPLPIPLIQSIRVGIWISLFMFDPIQEYLTPHVLSEWMVEVWCV